jgi:transcriptional regulator with XRE-family HTH domain
MSLSDLIKEIRSEAGDTPAAAAAKAGVSRPAYLKWESGDTENMKIRNLVKFCDAYKISVEKFVRGRIERITYGVQPASIAAETATLYAVTAQAEHTNEERDLIAGFRVATPETRDNMMYQARTALKTAKTGTHDPLPQG